MEYKIEKYKDSYVVVEGHYSYEAFVKDKEIFVSKKLSECYAFIKIKQEDLFNGVSLWK